MSQQTHWSCTYFGTTPKQAHDGAVAAMNKMVREGHDFHSFKILAPRFIADSIGGGDGYAVTLIAYKNRE
jgi:hypothetical protein